MTNIEKKGFKKEKSYKKEELPEPFEVPEDKKDWRKEFPGYKDKRVNYTAPSVLENAKGKEGGAGWADPQNAEEIERDFTSHEYKKNNEEIKFDEKGRPLNPRGRTGKEGRWFLGKWGANFAADSIITREKDGKLQCLLIQRKDTGEWALPGGMIDEGEEAIDSAQRELEEETGIKKEEVGEEEWELIYKGYVDDPRNTDNAWMETTAYYIHGEFPSLEGKAGDDAQEVEWVTLDKEVLDNLYASHSDILKRVERIGKLMERKEEVNK